MTFQVDDPVVAPSGELVIHVAVHSDRPAPVNYGVPACGDPLTVVGKLSFPTEPSGKMWDGIADEFKQYALTQGLGPGGVPALAPVEIRAPAFPCDGFQGERLLGSGETIESTLRLKAELTPGVPAPLGEVGYEITFGYDRQNGPPSRNPSDTGPAGSWFPVYKQLSASGRFTIAGDVSSIISPGLAIDAVLAHPGFASWLAGMPSRTWSNVNLYLETGTGEGDVIPKGAWWTVELFREVGVPRNWAIAVVDPFSGSVGRVSICANPCQR